MYSDEELSAFYPADYYAYHDDPKVPRWKGITKRLLGYWNGTREPRFETSGRFLDIGCGSGAFVARMVQQGWESYGVEVNRAAAELGQSKGLGIRYGTLQQATLPANFFDYVRASHSLEHVSCPHETLAEIRRILKPSGILLIAVPNIDSLNARLFKKYWWHLCPPVHTFSYSESSLTRMLKQHGFVIRKVVFNSDYVGLLGSLQIWLNRRSDRTSVQGVVFRLIPLRVVCGWLQKALDILGKGDMIEVTACNDKLDGFDTYAIRARDMSTSSKEREVA
jgi:SAM-dependent methyltransferase